MSLVPQQQEVFQAMSDKVVTPAESRKIKTRFNTGGQIVGNGLRDSVPILASPGEFVVRSAMVNKYGLPLLQDINSGSLDPKFNTPKSITYGNNVKKVDVKTSSNMYNNNYSVSITSNSNASADEIANKAVMKIREMNSMQIRGARG